jgi:hypothetical protein
LADPEVDKADWPDLVRVVATNGEEGYAYTSELEAAALPPNPPGQPSPEREELRAQAADAFVKALAARTSVDIAVDGQVAQQAHILAQESVTPPPDIEEAAIEELLVSKTNELAALLGVDPESLYGGHDLRGLIFDVLYEVQSVGQVDVNVFLSDGTTVIGVFKASR